MKSISILAFFLLNVATVLALDCGPNIGSCANNTCCSKYGWCGTASAYCGKGCQSGFGKCTSGSIGGGGGTGDLPVSTDGKCGTNGHKCPAGTCCSRYNYCGTGTAYCGKGCQLTYGKCASGVTSSSSTSTSTSTTTTSTTTTSTSTSTTATPTPTIAKVVTQCTKPGTVAITFDDGPYINEVNIAQKFADAGGRVTFYVNGNNYDCIYNRADQLKAVYAAGHQIASHTWSHPSLPSLSDQAVLTEMSRLNTAFSKILGVVPLHMRPPFGDYNAHVVKLMGDAGFKYVDMWSLDSGDSVGASVPQQQANYNQSPAIGHIALNHETIQSTADTMVPFIIQWAKDRNLKMVTVAECLGNATPYTFTTAETRNPSWVC